MEKIQSCSDQEKKNSHNKQNTFELEKYELEYAK